jgi:hypothetical protein
MLKTIYALCFAALTTIGCLDSSEPEALDESALDTPAVLDGEIGTQDCLGDCRNARIADLAACQPLPPGFREECRAAAWVKYDRCVQICL